MKATRYIAAFALLAGLLTSCQREWNPADDGDSVTVEFSVQFPEPVPVPTKAKMAEGPTLDDFNLYLCLYGAGDGYVQNWIPATLLDTQITNGYVSGGKFEVKLPKTTESRTVHFFVNPPQDLVPVTSMYLDEVMQKMINLKDDEDECSYWQQITLSKIQDAATVQNEIGNVHLVRNFAKIIVSGPDNSDGTKISVLQWTLINVPKKGYVAPYTGNTSARFPSGYLNVADYNTGVGILYNQLVENDNYKGYMPAPDSGQTTVIDSSFPGNPVSAPSGTYVGDGQALYMYERPVPNSADKQTSVLVQIKFGASHPTTALRNKTYWYKVEVVDQEGEYVPFLRDIVYRMNVESLEVAGYSSAQEAYNKEYFGNISASLETASLNDISNGKAKIHVDKIDYTFFAGNQTAILNPETGANFYFVPNTATGTAYTQTTANICTITLTNRPVEGFEPAVTGTPVNVSGAGVIQIQLAEMGTSVKKSVVRVTGKVANSSTTLYRDITVNLMPTQDFAHGSTQTRVTNTPTLTGAGNPVNIEICLPEGLGSSVFPIQVRIETEKNSLYSLDPDLPVFHGDPVFSSKTGDTFYMVYTINYSDYCSVSSDGSQYNYTYAFPITLYTNKRGSNATKIDIRDLGGCFNPKQLTI